MWKKDERLEEILASPTDSSPQRTAPAATPTQQQPRSPSGAATIGRSITFRGDITGEEDLVIQGRVEGSVDLHQHSVTVGPDGEVMASIVGRVVLIEGRVEGNVDGGEQVVLRSSALVKGDITAPRVVLENGARFRGLVDMGDSDELSHGSLGSRAEAKKGSTQGRSSGNTDGLRVEEAATGTNGSVVAAALEGAGASSGSANGSGAGSANGSTNGSINGSAKGRKPSEAENRLAV